MCSQTVIGTGEFFEVETRDLSDHVVDGRFERGWCCAACDVVHQLIQSETHCQFGRHFRNWETGGF
ncbi:Uncharacterised protein [Vibrio cholerae]|nr:Uncharacterised protein [Vibrio cholerae]CSB47206.1 Uncharacterised protein [Vibrio cholerae]